MAINMHRSFIIKNTGLNENNGLNGLLDIVSPEFSRNITESKL